MRKKNHKFVIILLLVAALAFFVLMILNSKSFEQNPPKINIQDTIYTNLKDDIKVNITDDTGVKNVVIEYSVNDSQDRQLLIDKNIASQDKNITMSVKFNKPEFKQKIDYYTLYIKAKDISYWNLGNEATKVVKVYVDTKKPIVNVISNSYHIEQGGSASVVFYAKDDNLVDVYIQTNDGKKFSVVPFHKDNFYASIIAWDIKNKNFRAEVIATDKAGNITKEYIRYYLKSRSYKTSSLTLQENFLNTKIKELYENYSDKEIQGDLNIFKYVNETLRDENEKIIHKITSKISDDKISSFNISPFLPLKNAAKVADFGDHRFYYQNNVLKSESYHMGLDLASVAMAPIVSSNNGVVVFAEENGIYGLNVLIDHGFGLYSLYGHCSEKNVHVGDDVKPKSQIARTGKTGLALGDHLHFGILVQGVEVRPEEWMDKNWIKDNITDVLKKAKETIDKQ